MTPGRFAACAAVVVVAVFLACAPQQAVKRPAAPAAQDIEAPATFALVATPASAASESNAPAPVAPATPGAIVSEPAPPTVAGGMTAEDELAVLFSTRMPMDDKGVPQVAVGLMESRSEVSIATLGPTQVRYFGTFEGQRIQKTMHLPQGGEFRVIAIETHPARVSYYPLLTTVPYGDAGWIAGEQSRWRERGIETRAEPVGAVNGLTGRVLDNRQVLILAEGSGEQAWAEALVKRLFFDFGLQTTLHEQLLERPAARLSLRDGANREMAVSENLVEFSSAGDSPITVRKVAYGAGTPWAGREDRVYGGKILLTAGRDGKLAAVNVVELTRYLRGVVPSETFVTAPAEALKAQAIAAAGHVLARIGTRHLADPYHLCAEQHCQVYGGVKKEHPATNSAVEATRGLLLLRGEQLVDTVYSANSGGHTENNEVAWAQPPNPSLRGRPDFAAKTDFDGDVTDANVAAFLAAEPEGWARKASLAKPGKFRWRKVLSERKVDTLTRALKVGHVRAIEVLGRGVSGRITAVKLRGTKREAIVQYELPVRRLFDNLPSGLFIVAHEPAHGGEFVFTGAGWGHGVGMCQTGAIGRAEAGMSFREILDYYYSGAELKKLF